MNSDGMQTISEDRLRRIEHLRLALDVAGLEVSEVLLAEDHDVLVEKMRLHYLDWGGSAEQHVLFLHGAGLTAHTWDLVCLALRQRYRCFALDLRGHGDSEWSPNLQYSIDALASDVDNFIRARNLTDLVVVGMSLGGLAALVFASDHPDLMKALVLVDIGPTTRKSGSERISQFMRLPDELDSVDDFVARSLAFNPKRDARLLRTSLLNNLHQLPNGKWTWKYDRRHRIRAELRGPDSRRTQLWRDVSRVACPTLVIRGANSDVFGDQEAKKLASALPNGQWVKVAKAGHTVQGDNPAGLVAALGSFLARVVSDPSGSSNSRFDIQ